MKGLQEKTDDGIFLVVKHGGIVQESKHPREGFAPIDVVNVRSGETTTKYIKRYKGVEALVKKIEWYDREFEDTRFMGWKLVLDANGIACTLDLPFESRVGSRFMKLAENIDYSQPVEFSAWKGPDDKTAFSVKQGGANVPQRYTREEPGDCPAPTQGFNKKWNFDAQKEFLHERMTTVVLPMVQAANAHTQTDIAAMNDGGDGPPTNGNGSVNGHGPLLDALKRQIGEYMEMKTISRSEALQEWFDTKVWTEIESMPVATLKAISAKMDDALVPF